MLSEGAGTREGLRTASRYDECDVIPLLTTTELLDVCNDLPEKSSGGKMAMSIESGKKTELAKLFPFGARCFGDSVGVQNQGIARSKLHFRDAALPVVKQS
jgi:hypothetical protein